MPKLQTVMKTMLRFGAVLALLGSFAATRPISAQSTCSGVSISVTPCPSYPTVAANSTINTTYVIHNYNASGWGSYLDVTATCDGSGITSCTPNQTYIYVPPGGTATVTLTYTTGAAYSYGWATLELTDTSNGWDIVDVPLQPNIVPGLSTTLSTYYPKDQDMRRCAADCFAATYTYSTVPFYTLDTPRSIALTYHGDRAFPRPVINTKVVMQYGATTPTEFRMSATLNGVTVPFTNGETVLHFQGGSYGRLAGQINASSYATGVYSLAVTVTAVYPNGSTEQDTKGGQLIIVNESGSAVAKGWTLTGIQRLYFTSGGYLVTDGDGSATFFSSLGQEADFTTLAASGGTYTRTYRDGTIVTFNSTGFMTALTDRYSRTTSVVYDGSNRVSQVIDPRRNMGAYVPYYQLSYGAYGLASISETGGPGVSRTATVNVGSDHNVSSIIDPDGIGTSFGYDGSGRLSTVTDRRGGVTTFAYNAGWKLSQVIAPTVNIDAGNGNTTPANPTTTLSAWQTAGVPQSATASAPAALLGLTFSGSVTDPANRSTSLALDVWGQPTTVTTALGQTTIVRSGHVPVRITYPNASVDSLKYDSQERAIMIGEAGDSPVSYHYAANGLIDTVSGAGTQKVSRQFDGMGHITRVDYNGGGYVNYYYDPSTQRLQTSVDNAGHTASYSYTSDGNLYQTVAAGGRVTTRSVDTHGRQASWQTSTMNAYTVTYDSLNRAVALYDGTGNAPTQFTYDALFQTDVRDANGNVTHADYNALGWTTQRVDPLGHATTYRYDPSGTLTSVTNRRGQRVNMTYDNAGRLTSKTGDNTVSDYFSYSADNRTAVAWNSLEIDSTAVSPGAAGGTSGVGSKDSTVTRIDGQRYRVLHGHPQSWSGSDSTTIIANTGVSFRVRYATVNPTNGEIGTYPDGFNTTSYAYNGEQLRYQTATTSGVTGTRTEYYTALHQIYEKSFSGGGTGDFFRLYHYDVTGRIDQVSAPSPVSTMAYGYDGLGRIVAANKYNCTGTITVDTINGARVPSCSPISYTSYSYDAVGNRTDHGGTYGAGNRIQQFGSSIFEHDLDGNVTRKYNTATGEDRHYTWSAEGRLTDVTLNGQTVHYDYNAYGQPVRKLRNGSVERYWLYEDDDLLAEFDATASNQRIGEYLYSPGVDIPYAMIVGETSPTQIWYYQQDEQGNIIGQQANTTPVQETDYDPWGVPSVILSNSTTSRLTWKGRMWDGDVVSLYYMRHRWYDPEIGRFMSEDPIGFAGQANRYVFGRNDPINGWDPSGLCDVTVSLCSIFPDPDPGAEWIWKKVKGLFKHHKTNPPPVARRKGPSEGPHGGFHEAGLEPAGWGDPLLWLEMIFSGGQASVIEGAAGGEVVVGETAIREAAAAEAEGGTYILRDPETGQVMRTGRTNNLMRRQAEHANDPALKDYNFEPVHHTDVYAEQRGLEQHLHDLHNPPLNKIRPISPRNPKLPEYIDAAHRFPHR